MKYRLLGKSGLRVSEAALAGTMHERPRVQPASHLLSCLDLRIDFRN